MGIVIRLAQAADVAAIRDIYNHFVAGSTCTFQLEPETHSERLAWFRDRSSAHPVTVAEIKSAVVGWAALSPWKSRCAYAHSVEASVYIRHGMHRQGLGRMLMQELIARAKVIGHHTIIAGICSEQTASLALFEGLDFQQVALFREVGRKFGRWLDVTYLQLLLMP